MIRRPLEMGLNLAGTKMAIGFMGQAQKVAPLYRAIYHDFIEDNRNAGANINVSILKTPDDQFAFTKGHEHPHSECVLPPWEVKKWLMELAKHNNIVDFPISKATISVFLMDGLLLFDPDTGAGHIYLFKQKNGCFRSLYRLFWMYFAQVLGEKGACFVHAAALARDGEGYLFMGDSGAGKSTLASLCTGYLVFSDDGPILLKERGEFQVFASPFHQMGHGRGLPKEALSVGAGLKGLFFLIQDSRLFLEKVPKNQVFFMILKRYIHYFPYLSARAKSLLFDLFFEVCNILPGYNLHFRSDQDIRGIITDLNHGGLHDGQKREKSKDKNPL